MPQDGPPKLSKLASDMQQLQQLLTSDPTKFKQVTADIATKLQDAAKTAAANGDTASAKALTNMADKFQQASDSGTMPDIHPHGHGGHHGHRAASASGSGSTTTSSTSSDSLSSSDLTQLKNLLASLQSNSTDNPMSTLTDVMDSALQAA